MHFVTLASFVFFTGLVGFLTWRLTRKDDHDSTKGYFLAGRSLTFPLIAGSLLLTNLSTEQMVGLNGAAFSDGFCVMVWEVVAVTALVAMALFFLPRFLRSGVTTVPEFLKIRFDAQTQFICNLIFLVAYMVILLPIILYTGATGMIGILDVKGMLGLNQPIMGIEPDTIALWLIVWAVGLIGSVYALFGGLRTVAVSDTINGIGLFVGGFLITGFALSALGGDGGMDHGMQLVFDQQKERFNSLGSQESSVPFDTVFTGILLLNLFYWTTNQQIIQRTFGASSLAEGQKGVLLTGAFKLLGPLYLVLPGMIAYSYFKTKNIEVTSDHAYGELVNAVLPTWLTGFFAAVMMGAILSSFNSALNSTCTLFSLGFYKSKLNPGADDQQLVVAGRRFGWIIAIAAMCIAPLLAKTPTGIFGYLQDMNGMYFIPIFSVVLVGMLTKRVPAFAAKFGLIAGLVLISIGYFVPPAKAWLVDQGVHNFHFLGMVFAFLVISMIAAGLSSPREEEWVQEDVGAVDMTPWKYAYVGGAALVLIVISIYVIFADTSIFDAAPIGEASPPEVPKD